MEPKDPNRFLSPMVRKAMEMQQKASILSRSQLVSSSFTALMANIQASQDRMGVAQLKAYKTGITNMFKHKNLVEKLMDPYQSGWLRHLADRYTETNQDDGAQLDIQTFDFIPDELAAEKKIKIYQEVPKLQSRLEQIYHDHRKLHELHWREFEEVIAELMMRDGWRVELTRKTRDGGCDLICLKSMDDMEFKLIGECKKNAPHRKIGIGMLRHLHAVVSQQSAQKGVLFTTSHFAADSVRYSKQYKPRTIELRDYDYITDWIRRSLNSQ